MSDDVPAFGTYALAPVAERLRRFGAGLGPGGTARRVRSAVRRLIGIGRSGPFDVEAFPGQRARLHPWDNLSEKRVLAAPEAWDAAERAALGRAVRRAPAPAFFVDAGANAGLYTLALRAEAAGRGLRVLAIEPDPENLSRLRFNLAASGAASEVVVAPVALSDRQGTLRLAAGRANRGEIAAGAEGIPVAARPLLDLLREAGFARIDALKIDVEGMELPVLAAFFRHAPRALWPGTVVIEAPRRQETPALAHLASLGYEIGQRTRLNAILSLHARDADVIGDTGNAHVNEA